MDFFRSRNFFSSVFALVVCLIGAAAFATYKQNEFKEAGNLLDHTHTAIFEVQDISSQILSLIALQRGYLLTQNEIFNQQYIGKQAEISQAFEQLIAREENNAVNVSKVIELQSYYLNLVEVLDSRIADPDVDLTNTESIETLKDQIRTVRNKFLDEKYFSSET